MNRYIYSLGMILVCTVLNVVTFAEGASKQFKFYELLGLDEQLLALIPQVCLFF